MSTQAIEERQLALLLRRQIALQKDSLMYTATDLVEQHFDAINSKDNVLTSAQLKSLEGVVFSSDSPSDVLTYIRNQANKETDKNKKPWTSNELNKKLLENIQQIVGRQAGTTKGKEGHKDFVVRGVRQAAGHRINEQAIQEWLDAGRERYSNGAITGLCLLFYCSL